MPNELRLVPLDAPRGAFPSRFSGLSPSRVSSYLRSCPMVLATAVEVANRHDPRSSIRLVWFTDGSWVWSSETITYVENHELSLPEELLETVMRSGAPFDIEPSVMQQALAIARSSTPAAATRSAAARFHRDANASRLVDLVRSAKGLDRAAFAQTWERVRDEDVTVGLLAPALRHVLSNLVAAAGGKDIAAVRMSAAAHPFPMSREVLDAVCEWAEGGSDARILDAQTTCFYAAQCAAFLLADRDASDLLPLLESLQG